MLEAQALLGAGGGSSSRSDTAELDHRLLRAGPVSMQKRLVTPSDKHFQSVCRSTHRLSKRRAALNQVFDANKKQPRGVKHLGALQAVKKKERRRRCSCEEYKCGLLEETSTLHPLLQSIIVICAGLVLSILRLWWIQLPVPGEQRRRSKAMIGLRWLTRRLSPLKMNKDPFVHEKAGKKNPKSGLKKFGELRRNISGGCSVSALPHFCIYTHREEQSLPA